MGLDIPEDPAPNGYVPNPYTSELDSALEYLRREWDSTDGWSDIANRDGVHMQKKNIPGDSSAIPLVRGRGVIAGYTPDQILPILQHNDVRTLWDGRFQEGHILERYSRQQSKFYSIQKGAFLVSQRDFVGAFRTVSSPDGSRELVQCSVPEDDKTRPVRGLVRGTLTLGGWVLKPVNEGTDITYVVKVNPNGSLPTTIINHVVSEIPACVVAVTSLIRSSGYPPFISTPLNPLNPESLKTTVRLERYTHNNSPRRTYVGRFIGEGSDKFGIEVDEALLFKDGKWEFEAGGDARSGVRLERRSGGLDVSVDESAKGQKFEITIRGT